MIKKFFIILYVSFFYIACSERGISSIEEEEEKQTHQVSENTDQTPKEGSEFDYVHAEAEDVPYVRRRPEPPRRTPERRTPERRTPERRTPERRAPTVSDVPPSVSQKDSIPDSKTPLSLIASYVSSKNLKFVFFEGSGEKGFGLYQEITSGYRKGDKALWLVQNDIYAWTSWLNAFSDDVESLIQLIDYDLVYSSDLKRRICQKSSTSNTTRAISLAQNVLFIGKLVFIKPDGTVEVYGKEKPSVFMNHFVDASDFSSFEVHSVREMSGRLHVRLEKHLRGSSNRINLKSVNSEFDYEELSQEGKIYLKDLSLEEYIHLLDSIYMQGTFSNCNDRSFYHQTVT